MIKTNRTGEVGLKFCVRFFNGCYQWDDEALSQFQEVTPENCILGCWGPLLLHTLRKKKSILIIGILINPWSAGHIGLIGMAPIGLRLSFYRSQDLINIFYLQVDVSFQCANFPLYSAIRVTKMLTPLFMVVHWAGDKNATLALGECTYFIYIWVVSDYTFICAT